MHQQKLWREETCREIIWGSFGGDHNLWGPTQPPQPRHSPWQCRHRCVAPFSIISATTNGTSKLHPWLHFSHHQSPTPTSSQLLHAFYEPTTPAAAAASSWRSIRIFGQEISALVHKPHPWMVINVLNPTIFGYVLSYKKYCSWITLRPDYHMKHLFSCPNPNFALCFQQGCIYFKISKATGSGSP